MTSQEQEREQLWQDIQRLETRRETLRRLSRVTGSPALQQRADRLSPLIRNLYDQLTMLIKSDSDRACYVRPKGGLF